MEDIEMKARDRIELLLLAYLAGNDQDRETAEEMLDQVGDSAVLVESIDRELVRLDRERGELVAKLAIVRRSMAVTA